MSRRTEFPIYQLPKEPGLTRLLHSLTTADQCKAMVERGHIYMTSNGRISMAGLNEHNVEWVAECIDKAIRGQL